MDFLLDESIDIELKKKLDVMLSLTFTDKELSQMSLAEMLNSHVLVKIIDHLFINANNSVEKTRRLLHMILYVYLYASIYDDEVLQAIGFEDLIEDNSVDYILANIINNDQLEYYITKIYYTIILDESILEEILRNTNKADQLENFLSWNTTFSNDYDTITYKLKMVITLFMDYLTLSESPNRDDQLIRFLYDDEDNFRCIEEVFKSKKEYLAYKNILIQMLYLDALLYLVSKKELSKIEKELLTVIQEAINNNTLNKLPDDKFLGCLLLEISFDVNFDKKQFLKDNEKHVGPIRELIKKTSPILLIEYY